MKERSTK